MQVAHVQLSPDRIRAVHQGSCSRLLLPAAAKYGETTIEDVMALPPEEQAQFCPRGQVGDILWVQEEWMSIAPDSGDWQWRVYSKLPAPGNVEAIPPGYQSPEYCLYAATFREGSRPGYDIRWAPAVSMPRWASRLYLKIMDVKLVTLGELTTETTDETGITLEEGDADTLDAFKRTLKAAFGDRFTASSTPFWSIRFARMDHFYVAQALEHYPNGVPQSAPAMRHAQMVAEALSKLEVEPVSTTINDSFAGMRSYSTSPTPPSSSANRPRRAYATSGSRHDSVPTSRIYGGYRGRT